MALLVNYEGTYLPPQKLWYLVDGVWTEVKQVFENNTQNEIAVLDQNRIHQDQVVTSLQTKFDELMARIDGSDITVPMETDPVIVDQIIAQAELISLQLNIAKAEQVVLTKSLFEQKAQLEYIKLVGEGERALSKIATTVLNPAEWLCIRVAPQSTLDERLDVVIQQGLPDDSRIFNYGLVCYRLFKIGTTDKNDDTEYLRTEFKRRLSNLAYINGIEATNHIFTIDTIQNIYTEVNQFVNAGAKRIEDYLASIKDQQKYILDTIEVAKESMVQLEQAKIDGLVPVNASGQIMTMSTLPELQVPLGEKLLAYQNVTSFTQLVSTQVLNDIAAGTKAITDYPGITKLNTDATSLNEKIQAIQDFQVINNQIAEDLVSGKVSFNLNILTSKKVSLNVSKNLFWSTPLGDSTVAGSGGSLTYKQTYTSSGTYKFKNGEMVTLSTKYTAIISQLLATTKLGELAVTFTAGGQPKIIQMINGYIYAYGETSPVIPSVKQTAIVNVSKAFTKELNIGAGLSMNQNAQPHHSIVFVKGNTTVTTDPNILLSVYHPVINGLFYANTEPVNFSSNLNLGSATFEYAYDIRQLPAAETPVSTIAQSFGFNTKEIPLTNWFINNDNIVTQVKEEIQPVGFGFNTFTMPTRTFINNDNIISQLETNLYTGGLLSFNLESTPLPAVSSKNDNIIQQVVSEAISFGFNAYKTNSYEKIKNGYGTLDIGFTTGTLASAPGLTLVTYNLGNASLVPESEKLEKWINSFNTITDFPYGKLELGQKSRIILSSQTGLTVHEFAYPDDMLNKLIDSVPRMLTAQTVRVHEALFTEDTLNKVVETVPLITTLIKSTMEDLSGKELSSTQLTGSNPNNINAIYNDTIHTTTMITSVIHNENTYSDTNASELLNKEIASIVVPTLQLNPGVVIE